MQGNEVVLVDTGYYWQGLYVNGELVFQNHNITIQELENYVPISVFRFETLDVLDDTYSEDDCDLPLLLSQLKLKEKTNRKLVLLKGSDS